MTTTDTPTPAAIQRATRDRLRAERAAADARVRESDAKADARAVIAAAAAATPAPALDSLTVTPDAFRAAMAAVDAGEEATGTAGASLVSLTLSAFRDALDALDATRAPGARYMYTGTGDDAVKVATSTAAKAATVKLWNLAGFAKAPEVKGRSKSAKSLANYVSRMGRVATSLDYGRAALDDVATYATAYETMTGDASESARESEDIAFNAFLTGLSDEDRDHYDYVRNALSATGWAAEHTNAFVRVLRFKPGK